jgi:hypothetical protein
LHLRPFKLPARTGFSSNHFQAFQRYRLKTIKEAEMPRVITLDKGNKRRLRGIRWSIPEKLSAAALFLLLVGFCIAVALLSSNSKPSGADEHVLQIRR